MGGNAKWDGTVPIGYSQTSEGAVASSFGPAFDIYIENWVAMAVQVFMLYS